MSVRLSAVLFCWLVILQAAALAGSDRHAVLTGLAASGAGPHAWKRPAGSIRWLPARPGERFGEGDSLKTVEGSRAELTFTNGITTRLRGSADIQVSSQGLPGTGLVLRHGKAVFRTDGPSLTVMTAHTSVTTHQAELVVEPTARGTRVAVMSGSVRVQGELQEAIHEIVEVATGQQTTVPAQGPPPEPQAIDPQQLAREAGLAGEAAPVPSPMTVATEPFLTPSEVPAPPLIVPDLPSPSPAGPLSGIQSEPEQIPPAVSPPAPTSPLHPTSPPPPRETESPAPAPVAVSLPVEPSPEVPAAPPEAPSVPPVVIPPLVEPSPEPSPPVTPSPAASPSPQVVPSPSLTPPPQRPPRPIPRDNPPLPLPANPPVPGIAPGVLARMIVVKSEHRLYFYETDGRLRKVYKIGLGTRWTPTPPGIRAVGEKIPNPTGVAWALWPSSRGRAFGNRLLALYWYDPSRKRLTAKSKQELHGTDVRHSVGANYSHGCMRMFNEDIEEIYQNVKVGDIIIVRD